MRAPVNVVLKNPTAMLPTWPLDAARWAALNQEAGGNPDFYPLTIKAAYVIGIIHDTCTSVSCLLRAPRELLRATYLPAFGVCASGIEVLGRCILGVRDTGSGDAALRTGFKWLAQTAYAGVPDNYHLVQTTAGTFDIEALAHLRHFAAHGQATAKPGPSIHQLQDVDTELLSRLPPLIADGLERWWNELQRSEELCNSLARANVIAFRSWPVFKMWRLFEKDAHGRYRTITDLFLQFDWRV